MHFFLAVQCRLNFPYRARGRMEKTIGALDGGV
jgi:hypothetical protein